MSENASNQDNRAIGTLNAGLIQRINQYSDDQHEQVSQLGRQIFDAFGYNERTNQISSQVRNLQQIACSAIRFADIEDFIKNQMGKTNTVADKWRLFGNDLLYSLDQLRSHAEKLSDSKEKQFLIRLKLARNWVRAVVSQYLYQVARTQMENPHE
jgi:hypothetical protein